MYSAFLAFWFACIKCGHLELVAFACSVGIFWVIIRCQLSFDGLISLTCGHLRLADSPASVISASSASSHMFSSSSCPFTCLPAWVATLVFPFQMLPSLVSVHVLVSFIASLITTSFLAPLCVERCRLSVLLDFSSASRSRAQELRRPNCYYVAFTFPSIGLTTIKDLSAVSSLRTLRLCFFRWSCQHIEVLNFHDVHHLQTCNQSIFFDS